MKRKSCRLALSAAVAAFSGACVQTPMDNPNPPQADLDDVLALFNADLGDGGVAVSRDEVEAAFRGDAKLSMATLADVQRLQAEGVDVIAGLMTP